LVWYKKKNERELQKINFRKIFAPYKGNEHVLIAVFTYNLKKHLKFTARKSNQKL
jgi:hypothetical protein